MKTELAIKLDERYLYKHSTCLLANDQENVTIGKKSLTQDDEHKTENLFKISFNTIFKISLLPMSKIIYSVPYNKLLMPSYTIVPACLSD